MISKASIDRVERLVRDFARGGRKPGSAIVIYDRETGATLRVIGNAETAGTVAHLPHNGREELEGPENA